MLLVCNQMCWPKSNWEPGEKTEALNSNACGTHGSTDLVSLRKHVYDARGTVAPVDQAIGLIA